MNLRLSRKDSFGGSFFMQKRNQCKNRVKRHCKKVSQEENQRFWVPVMVKEGTSKSIYKGTTGNKSYTANWTPINYTITYNLDGGTANNKTSYNIETATFTLSNPTKNGYVFVGWTGSNGTTPQKNVSIAKGTTGNKSYTAIFEKIIQIGRAHV